MLGLPGAGKSTVGPIVARALGRAFVDLDLEIERREGLSIEAIFAAEGEGKFRALERRLTARVRVIGLPVAVAPAPKGRHPPARQSRLRGCCLIEVGTRA